MIHFVIGLNLSMLIRSRPVGFSLALKLNSQVAGGQQLAPGENIFTLPSRSKRFRSPRYQLFEYRISRIEWRQVTLKYKITWNRMD